MALIVPLLAFAALFWTYRRRGGGADPRGAVLAAGVTWGLLATGIARARAVSRRRRHR